VTRTAHITSGAILALSAISHYNLISDIQLPDIWLAGLVISILAGSTAPDWMEIPYFSKTLNTRVSIIPHRTVTHWLLLWGGILFYCLIDWNNPLTPYDPMILIVLGFSMGAVTHCIMDWLTADGVPVFVPFLFGNQSLHMIRGLTGEWLSMLSMGAITYYLIKYGKTLEMGHLLQALS
jgi:membrane-bound metal-dependent hydrolase YbcI (DUF457 family)